MYPVRPSPAPMARSASRAGNRAATVRVREGSEDNIAQFHELLLRTAERQGFRPESEAYLRQLWRLFDPHGYCKLLLAEKDDELVSAALIITFGDTVLYKRGAWSGGYGNLRPNEAMHWSAIQWAKKHGYRSYDFEGIDSDAARSIVQGERVPSSAKKSVTRFKVGFGGAVKILPDTHACIYNPVLRWAFNTAVSKLKSPSTLPKICSRIRSSLEPGGNRQTLGSGAID